MSIDDLRTDVTDLCLAGLLRCLRMNTTHFLNPSTWEVGQSLGQDLLRFYWALTKGVEDLAKTVVQSPRRLTTSISYEEVERIGDITGTLNASATVMAQALTLNPAIFIVSEPNTTALSEPNHLIAWTLSEALDILLSSRKLDKSLDRYEWFNSKISLIEHALRNEMLLEVLSTPDGRKRPRGYVLRAAAKARVPVYQTGVKVFELLEGIESGRIDAIETCLSNTLVANLEYWQRLEAGTALKAAEILSKQIHEPIRLSFPFVQGDKPIATVGPFEVFWQYSIPRRQDEQLDISEKWSSEIASFIGTSSGNRRSDVAICCRDEVFALFECKYFESSLSASQAIVDASSQIVQYARDLHPDSLDDAADLISRSCIVVADRGRYQERTDPHSGHRFVYFTDVAGLNSDSLRCWAVDLALRNSS
jgi:hypothetical protein